VDLPGFDTRAIVISFMPEFGYSPGSRSHDYMFLLPFCRNSSKQVHVLRPADTAAPPGYDATAKLLQRFFSAEDQKLRQAGRKAFLLALFYHLLEHCSSTKISQWEFIREQQRALCSNLFLSISAAPSLRN
jgi:hypothetical protein